MQKINIYTKNRINKEILFEKIKTLLVNSEVYNPDTNILIYDEERTIGQLKDENTLAFCELFAYENKDINPKEEILKKIFSIIAEEIKIKIESISGVIHQLNKDHYITSSEHVTIESNLREDSFKTLGI